jgi:hypothetical protein
MAKKFDRLLSAKEQAFHRQHMAHGGEVRVVPLKHKTRPGVIHHCKACDKAHFEPGK